MKNKFLKVFGIFAVICLSVITLAGCSIQLDKEQQDKVMTVVDNADQFMYDMLENLEKQNSKLGREESFKAVKEAFVKFSLNSNNVWNNLRLSYTGTIEDECFEEELYKAEDGNYILVYSDDDVEYISYGDLSFVEHESRCIYHYKKYDNGIKDTAITYEPFICLIGNVNLVDGLGLTENDVLATKVLDNGHNHISFTKNEEDDELLATYFLEIEFKDGVLYQIDCIYGHTDYIGDYDDSNSENGYYIENPSSQTIKFEYGVVNGNEMEAKYKEAKDYIASQN